jgi:hypothetical protein
MHLSRDKSVIPKSMKIGDADILPSKVARNLGFTFDSAFTFQPQISQVRKAAFYQLRRLQSCKDYIPKHLLPVVTHSFVTSRLDYCNSLYLKNK